MSLLSVHKEAWVNCTRCPLSRVRRKVVICRGVVPCEVLFIGEAPGASEDSIGLPFIGPAGKLLDYLIRKAEIDSREVAKCWTNLVGCVPRDENTKRKAEEPLPEEIEACSPRVDDFIGIAKPKLIVAVGDLAKKQGIREKWEERAKVISIVHPAWLLRAPVQQVGLAKQRVTVALAEAFGDLR